MEKESNEYEPAPRLLKMLDNFDDGIIIVENNKVVYVNERLSEIFGYSKEELKKLRAVDVAIPEEKERLLSLKQESQKRNDKTLNIKFWAVRKDGTRRYIQNKYFFGSEEERRKGDFYLIISDITDLLDQKALVESIFKAAPTGIGVVVDRQLREVNDRFCDLVGYSQEELLGKSVAFIYPSVEEFERVGRVKYEMMSKHGIGTIETKFKRKDGKIIDVLLSSSPIDPKDWSKGVTFTALDMTERKQIENDLRTEKRIFEKISIASPTGIVMVNKNGEITFANPQAEIVLGLTKDEITRRNYDAPSWKITRYDGSAFPSHELPFLRVKREKKAVYDVRHAIEHPDGTRTYLTINATPLFAKGNEFDGMLAIIEDISEKIHAEEKLRESEETFRSVFESIPIGMHLYRLNPDNKLIFSGSNRSSDEILKIETKQFIGKTIEEAFPPLVDTDIPKRYKSLARDEGEWKWENVEYEDEKIKGAYEVIAFHIAPNTMVTSFVDVAEQLENKRIIIESEKKYRKAFNRAEFFKDLFAHDINNILQNIKLSVQLNLMELNKFNNPEKLLNSHHVIEEQVNRGAKLVSNIRKLSEIEEENISLKKTEIYKVLNDSIAFVEKSFQHKNINIDLKTISDEIFVLGNEFLREVFDNILLNSIKYTQNSTILIKIVLSREKWKDKNTIKIEFIDNGMGIPDQLKEKIFQRAFSEGKSTKGMGLGLSLVKKIMESYQGEIRVEDRIAGDYSKGSNFILYFLECVD